jgi:hypothetical protein
LFKSLLSRSVLHRLAFSSHFSSKHLAAAMADFKLQFGVYASLSSSVEEVENLCRSRDLIVISVQIPIHCSRY